MPELPEVEVSRQSLWRHMEGGLFLTPDLIRSDVIRVLSPNLSIDEISGKHVVSLTRRGKYLIWTLASEAGDEFLLIHHFRMTGALVYSENPLPPARLAKHVHVIFPVINSQGSPAYLFWHDIRRFGLLEWLRKEDLEHSGHTILSLGPEPFSPEFSPAYLKSKAGQHKALRLPAFFLNQQVVAGLGNIYVNEALFLARLHPDKRAGNLRLRDCERLVNIFRDILLRSINQGGTSFRNYIDGDGRKGSNQNHLLVYGRQGLPCVRCGMTLESVTLNGRRTVFCPRCQKKKGKESMLFYVSGYSGREATTETSIKAFDYDVNLGFTAVDRPFPYLRNVSYMIMDFDQKRLFGVLEGMQGSVFELDMSTVDASPAVTPIAGQSPCHLVRWRDYIITADYLSGTLSVLHLGQNGPVALGEIQHRGSGPNQQRQEGPHAHWVGLSPEGKYLLAVDLGCDAVFSYDLVELGECLDSLRTRTTGENASDITNDEIRISAKYRSSFPAGSGPRHLVTGPDGKQMYLVSELSAELYVMDYSDGQLRLSQSFDISVPDGPVSADEPSPSAIHITNSGSQVLASVRGTDCIWSFNRNENGRLTYADHKHAGAVWPRDFNILPDDKSVIVGGERSNLLTSFVLDPKSGKLTRTEHQIEKTMPTCILPV